MITCAHCVFGHTDADIYMLVCGTCDYLSDMLAMTHVAMMSVTAMISLLTGL